MLSRDSSSIALEMLCLVSYCGNDSVRTCANKLCQTQPQREKRSKIDINFAQVPDSTLVEEGFVRRERPGTHTINRLNVRMYCTVETIPFL